MVITKVKKKKVSKKLKSSWRKHVDINDVEDFLEERRLDERLGSLDTVPNESLFKVDSKSSTEILSKKQIKKLAYTKPLKCFSALQSYTKVPDPISKRNRVRTKEERESKFVKEKRKLKADDVVKSNSIKEVKKLPKRGEFNENLWDDMDNKKGEDWIEKNTNKHNLRGTGIAVRNNINSIKKKKLPAIEIPHPGISYNPSFQDHQDLLHKVYEKELKLIKEEKHLDRVTRGMFSKVTGEKRDQDWLVDMSEGLPSKNNPQDKEEDSNSDGEYKSINPPVKNAKKTLKQRRKKKEHLEMEKTKRTLKLQKKKITDIHNLKKIVKHVETVDQKYIIQQEIRKKKKELKKDKTKVLSAIKFEEPDLEFNLGKEISGNLKDLKTEGNLLRDRFKSMQKRNILAPTKRNTIKKAKVKKYTKPGHKEEDWKKTVARTF